MAYAKKIQNGFFKFSDQKDDETFFPLNSSINFPVVENALVFDSANQEWIYDQSLLTADVVNKDKKQKLDRRRAWRAAGENILDGIIELNSAKIAAGSFTLPQIKTMTRDPDLVEIKDLLSLGDLKGARYAIQNYSGIYYTESDKTAIIAEINQALGE